MTRCAETLLLWGLLLQISDVAIGAAFPQKSQGLDNTTCTTNDNQPGICVDLKQCKKLYNLIVSKKIVRNRENEELFRNNDCGWNNNEPKVCCSETPLSISVTKTPFQPISNSTSAPDQPILSSEPLSGRITKSKPTECGRTDNNEFRIIGGRPAALGKWPWMVALGYRRITDPEVHFYCGASLIADEWLLTAAHCAKPADAYLRLVSARLGDLDLNPQVKDNATPVDIPIDQIIVHPKYATNRRNFDIALLRLKRPVQFSKLIKPICLYSGPQYEKDEFYKRKQPFVVGWGVTENGTAPTQLYEVSVDTHDLKGCIDKFSKIGGKEFTDNILCAGQRGRDACQGDSGGPLIFVNSEDATYYLGGVVSAGRECGTEYPGLYMKVAKFIGWINDSTRLDF